jgi:3-oxoacyl-[acyl-carrier protein] reductase
MLENLENCLRSAQLLEGKTGVITGAADGIGLACAHMFAAQGARVFMVDLDQNNLLEAVGRIEKLGFAATPITADVTSPPEVERIFEQVAGGPHGLDILVNNAGGGLPTDLMDISLEEWNRIVGLNLTAAFSMCQQAARIMINQKRGGAIVNMSSVAGRSTSVTAGAHYTSSKAGLLGLTRHLARSLAPHDIRVNAVCPGVIGSGRILKRLEDTDRRSQVEAEIPLGRLGLPQEAAAACLFLASDMSSFVTGASLDVNGGSLMI